MVHVYEVQNGIHKQLCKGLIIHKIMIQVSVNISSKKKEKKKWMIGLMNTELVFNTCLLLQNLFILIMYLHVLIQYLYQLCGFMLIKNTITILIY